MEYWAGIMTWPIDPQWRCETCGDYGSLIWGFVHGVCRCDTCHTQYAMRDGKKRVTTPICLLKPEYKAPARIGWQEYHKPISMWDDSMWDWAMGETAVSHSR